MPAQHAEPAARRIQENAIKQNVGNSPAQRRRSEARIDDRSGGYHIAQHRPDDRDAQTAAVLTDQAQSRFIPIDGDNLAVILHERGQMSRLSSRSGTGVQHTIARLRIEEQRNELRRFILDIEPAFVEQRQ